MEIAILALLIVGVVLMILPLAIPSSRTKGRKLLAKEIVDEIERRKI